MNEALKSEGTSRVPKCSEEHHGWVGTHAWSEVKKFKKYHNDTQHPKPKDDVMTMKLTILG
jgi:hypothetical protein